MRRLLAGFKREHGSMASSRQSERPNRCSRQVYVRGDTTKGRRSASFVHYAEKVLSAIPLQTRSDGEPFHTQHEAATNGIRRINNRP